MENQSQNIKIVVFDTVAVPSIWEATIDIHLGHKIAIHGQPIQVPWTGQDAPNDEAVVARWIVKDPKSPGQCRDYSTVLSGKHARRFNRLPGQLGFVATFDAEDVPLRLDTFGQTQIKQWCRDILQIEKKPKETYLCFDLVRIIDNKVVTIKNNILTYKTTLKGYRFSKTGSTGVTQPFGQVPIKTENSSSKESSESEDTDINLLFPFLDKIASCSVAGSEPLPWSMLTAFAIRAVPEARPEAMVTILESTLEKKWVFRKRACHHVVELESLQKLVFWSGYPTMSQAFRTLHELLILTPSLIIMYGTQEDALSRIVHERTSATCILSIHHSSPRILEIIRRPVQNGDGSISAPHITVCRVVSQDSRAMLSFVGADGMHRLARNVAEILLPQLATRAPTSAFRPISVTPSYNSPLGSTNPSPVFTSTLPSSPAVVSDKRRKLTDGN